MKQSRTYEEEKTTTDWIIERLISKTSGRPCVSDLNQQLFHKYSYPWTNDKTQKLKSSHLDEVKCKWYKSTSSVTTLK